MSEKTSAEVIIGGKVYTLSGYEGEEYLQRVATYINNKVHEFDHMEAFRRFSVEMKATMIQLNIADDYFKARTQVEKLEQQLENKDKEIYNLKHDLISNQIKMENEEKALRASEEENRRLSLELARLETSLEEAQRNGEMIRQNSGASERSSEMIQQNSGAVQWSSEPIWQGNEDE